MAKILDFTEISKKDNSLVGGKGGSLGEMTQAGAPVPPGFVVTTEVYRQFNGKEISFDVVEEILNHFDKLGLSRVAVRSSAIAEDSEDASWAGQFDSILNVTRDGLIDAIYECWKSASSNSVGMYASRNKIDESQLILAVVVQKMIDSDVSGVVFTKNPVTGDEDELMMEACYGLGELLVQGMVTPDNYLINKSPLLIKEKRISTQVSKIVNTESGTETVEVDSEIQGLQKISDEKILELTEIALSIENHYGCSQDIEWAVGGEELYILQSRPVTTG